MYTKTMLDSSGKTPVYSSESTNNGIIGYTNNEPEFLVDNKNPIYIIFGDHTRTFNIALESFSVSDNVKVLAINEILSIRALLYIISSWKKTIPNLGYARHWSVAKNTLINLPTKKSKIDFDFMESFISELEAGRVAELEAYLIAANLKDYTLTKEEKKVLKDFENSEFFEFDIINIFDVKNTGNILSRDIKKNSGKIPYLTASTENNAVSSYISYNNSLPDKGNCVFIGGKTFVVTYQEKDFFSNDSHNLILHLRNKNYKKKYIQLYLVTCVQKSLSYKYSWGDSVSNKKIQTDIISLPIKNRKPDYESMENFITAIQKLVIKDLVHYSGRKIEAARILVNSHKIPH